MWFLLQDRGIRLFAGDLFYNGSDNLCQSESGCKQYDRAKKGARFGVFCSITIAELIGIIIYVAAPVLITAFNRDPDVVHYGVMQSRTIALFYCLLAFSHCIAAILRGSGNASVPMIVMLCDWCLFRVSYITVAVRILPDIRVDFLGIPIDLGYQLRDFSVSVLTWKMGLRIREILIAIPNNRTKFSLHFRFLQALLWMFQ